MNQFISIVVIIGWIALILSLAVICRNSFPNQKELSRKIVHIGTGPLIPFAWILGIPSGIAIPIASIVTIALVTNHQLGLFSALEDVNRQSYGTIAYGLSITLLLIFLWPTHADAVSAGVLVMSFGDGLAGLIGRQVKSPQWIIFNQRKSIAGTFVMAITGTSALFLLALISGISFNPLLIIAIGFFAACLEQISPWGIDNLTVPIGVAFGWLWVISY